MFCGFLKILCKNLSYFFLCECERRKVFLYKTCDQYTWKKSIPNDKNDKSLCHEFIIILVQEIQVPFFFIRKIYREIFLKMQNILGFCRKHCENFAKFKKSRDIFLRMQNALRCVLKTLLKNVQDAKRYFHQR